MDTNKHTTNNLLVKLLWTGGWDSTFRLVELSRKTVTVQPIYLYGDGRKSVDFEIQAMEKILILLKEHPDTKANLLPLNRVNIATIPENQAITKAYQNIIKRHRLGSQYEWIARYAAVNPGVELCSEKPHENGIGYMQRLITHEGRVCPTHDVHEYRVETDSEDVRLILGNVFFPIKGKTEVDMKNLIRRWGYEDIMQHIWFCHFPIDNKPCGICRPCCEKVESEMSFLLDRKALKRNRIYNRLGGGKLSKAYNRVVRFFSNR